MPIITFEKKKPMSVEELKILSRKVHQEMTDRLKVLKKARSVKPSKKFRSK